MWIISCLPTARCGKQWHEGCRADDWSRLFAWLLLLFLSFCRSSGPLLLPPHRLELTANRLDFDRFSGFSSRLLWLLLPFGIGSSLFSVGRLQFHRSEAASDSRPLAPGEHAPLHASREADCRCSSSTVVSCSAVWPLLHPVLSSDFFRCVGARSDRSEVSLSFCCLHPVSLLADARACAGSTIPVMPRAYSSMRKFGEDETVDRCDQN